MNIIFSRFLLPLLLVCASLTPALAGEATKTLSSTVDRVLVLLSNPNYKNPATRPPLRRELIQTIESIFDTQELSRRALGANWKRFTPEQRTRFIKAFGTLLQNTYLDKIESYTDEKVQYLGEQSLGAGKTEVATKVMGKGKEIPITYRLIDHNGWKIYDVVIEGVSLVQNYRSQFGQILVNETPDALIKKIVAKNA